MGKEQREASGTRSRDTTRLPCTNPASCSGHLVRRFGLEAQSPVGLVHGSETAHTRAQSTAAHDRHGERIRSRADGRAVSGPDQSPTASPIPDCNPPLALPLPCQGGTRCVRGCSQRVRSAVIVWGTKIDVHSSLGLRQPVAGMRACRKGNSVRGRSWGVDAGR